MYLQFGDFPRFPFGLSGIDGISDPLSAKGLDVLLDFLNMFVYI